MDWRELSKIDAHIHLLPREVHDANPGEDDEFSHAKQETHVALMERYHIERAVIMTFNDPFLLSMDFTVDAVHQNLARMCAAAPERYAAAADIDTRNTTEISCAALRQALAQPCFRCVKLHPSNSGIPVDDSCNDAVAELAIEWDVPVAIHSYPAENDPTDACAPARIAAWIKRHPGLKPVVCHLGGFQWEDALALDAYFDLSAILPDYAARYGVRETNRILRRFGAERLLFATDWPCSRSVAPGAIYERYFDLLNEMDFTPSEARRIAYENAKQVYRLE